MIKLSNNIVACIALLAGIICCLVYWRALSCSFVDYDDPFFVINNVYIRNLDTKMLAWAFTKPLDFWIPLTFISLAIDYHFWALNPLGYHLTNIGLHAVNTGLVVLIADALLRDSAAQDGTHAGISWLYPGSLLFAGLFFGIHPLRVESVAWVTERKDVLNGVFTFSAALMYLRYARLKDAGGERRTIARYYLLSIGLFALSLMAKSSSVVIPALFLVADYYPLQRLNKTSASRLVMEKIPYFVLSLLVSLITLGLGSQKQMLAGYETIPLFERITLSGNALFEYCRLLIYPTGIIPYYQMPTELPFAFISKSIVISIVTVSCLSLAKKRPLVCTAWVAFIIPFLPVLAFFQNGSQMYAARYTYLPSLVPGIVLAAGVASSCTGIPGIPGRAVRLSAQRILLALLYAVLFLYGVMTVQLIPVWDNTETLWSRVIAIRPVGLAYYNRGTYYLEHGRLDAAINDYTTAIENNAIMGDMYSFNYYAFRGLALYRAGRYEESVRDFSAAIADFPQPNYFFHRGRSMLLLGKETEARHDFLRAGQESGPLSWQNR